MFQFCLQLAFALVAQLPVGTTRSQWYDERGVGESGGKFDDATTADFAQDAASAVEFLKKHPRVDSKSIGLIGHSEGGLVAPLVACQDDQVAWIVLMAGPGVNGAQITFSQGRLMILAARGGRSHNPRNRLPCFGHQWREGRPSGSPA